jgi:biotin carboxylase
VPRALLLLPTATYRAGAFLDAAGRLGVDVVVGSEVRQAMGESMGDRFVLLPLNRPSESADMIVRYAQRHPLDAVLAVDDQGSLTAAIACERLGLRHSPAASVAATRDKSAMRELFHRAGVPQPGFRLAGGAFPPPLEAAQRVGFPVVLKPRTLSGSRGVIRVDTSEEIAGTYQRIQAILAAAGEIDTVTILVEELARGPEVAVEGLLRAGVLDLLAVFDKPDQGDGPYFEETMYVTPSRLPQATLDALGSVTARAVKALNLTEGPVHAELRVSPDHEEPLVIEVAARTIGGRCSRALSFAGGATLEELVLAHALGPAAAGGLAAGGPAPAGATAESGPDGAAPASGVMMIPIPSTGVLEEVGGIDEALAVAGVSGVEITAHPGGTIERVPEGGRYLGFLFADGETPEAVETSLRDAHAALRVRISPIA